MPDSNSAADDLRRYEKQMRFTPIGEAGQRRLAASRVLVCGCGALGSVVANQLVRSGVGFVRIVDRDFLELSNLQRQMLYDEADLASGLPKAVIAARKLRTINSQVQVDSVVADVTHKNLQDLANDVDVIVDGSDNFELRYLVNDYALRFDKPWVFGGVLGAEGQSMTIVPGETACFACLVPEPPPAGSVATCDTAGVLATAVALVASIEATEAIKLLSGNASAINRELTIVDLWTNRLRSVDLNSMRNSDNCPACGKHDYAWLEGRRGSKSAVLCGRNAVQLRPGEGEFLPLDQLADRLASVGSVMQNDYLLRLEVDDFTLTVFPDGRAIVGGTDDESVARGIYSRYVGS